MKMLKNSGRQPRRGGRVAMKVLGGKMPDEKDTLATRISFGKLWIGWERQSDSWLLPRPVVIS